MRKTILYKDPYVGNVILYDDILNGYARYLGFEFGVATTYETLYLSKPHLNCRYFYN